MVSYIILKYKEKVELIFVHSTTLKEFLCLMTIGVPYIPCRTVVRQGWKLRLTGRQCDQKLSTGD